MKGAGVSRSMGTAFITIVLALGVTFGAAAPARAQEARTPQQAAPSSACTGAVAGTRSMIPDDCWGRVPSSHYDIGCDEGAWNNVGRKVYCLFTDMTFQGARALTSTGLWMIGWAFGLNLHEQLGAFAVDVADRLQQNLIGPLSLLHFVWLYAVAWAALKAMRGRVAMAGGELLVSFVVAAGAAFILGNPAGYLSGVFETMQGASVAVLSAGTGEPLPADPSAQADTVEPVQTGLHQAFVGDPYDYLNWGGPLIGACANARDEILAEGPHGNDDEPRDMMRDAGCEFEADFNHDPSGSRLFGAVLTLFAATTVVVLLALMAMTLVVAQVFLIILFGLAPLSLLAGILPGAGRELLWRWLASLLRSVLAVVGMSFVLAVLLTTATAVLRGASSMGIIERFALVDAVVIAMFVARKRILAAGHNWAGAMGQRMASRRAGGGREAAWMTSPAIAGATGFALASSMGPDRNTRTSRLAGTVGRNQLADRRMKRHSERNANRVTARERSELRVGPDGTAERRAVATVDGPVARSRRARGARARVENRTADRHARNQRARYANEWSSKSGEANDVDLDSTEADLVDAEEA